MPTARDWEGRTVLGSDGTTLGVVSSVLFHLSEPRVVGIEVRPPAFAYVIARRPRYVPFEDVRLEGGDLRIAARKLPSDASGEKRMGASWEQTVIWRGMAVASADGERVGIVFDVAFDETTGAVTGLSISTGALGDAAVGRLEVAGEHVRGFNGDSVVVSPGYARIPASGGVARRAAAGAAAVKVHGGRAAVTGLRAAGYAAGRIGRSFERGYGKKAIDKLKSLMGDDE